uniref:Uncharacterized protein n=1 Tax=Anguilla anguilla TaxID=7936 RepID=A0A0E9Q7Q2_ANGAN
MLLLLLTSEWLEVLCGTA